VIRAFDLSATVVLDGVTIEGGEGAGVLVEHVKGAGIYSENSHLSIHDCVLRRNAAWQGAAAYFLGGSATLSETVVVENVGHSDGRAVVHDDESALEIVGCTFTRNRGGALDIWGNTRRIEGCTFLENVAPGPSGAGITMGYDANAEITDCAFIGNVGAGGPGILTYGIARVRNSIFFGNSAQSGGGAISSGGGISLTNCTFSGNTAGGFTFYPYQTVDDGFAGAINNAFGSAILRNCTLIGNSAGHIGGLYAGYGADVINCLFWNNRHEGYPSEQTGQISGDSTSLIDIDYSIVQGWTGSYGGIGNSGLDPMLVDADGADDMAGTEDDDLRLLPGSPAINAGNPNATGLPPTDLDGHARVLCDRVDIGAYEFGIGDYDCDQSVDLLDFSAWSSCMTGPHSGPYDAACEAFDFDTDSDVDLLDYAALAIILNGR
jgi:predicted outer membrane repeat protein